MKNKLALRFCTLSTLILYLLMSASFSSCILKFKSGEEDESGDVEKSEISTNQDNESDSLRAVITSQLNEIEMMQAKFRMIAQELDNMNGEIPVATDDNGFDAVSDRLEQKLQNLRNQLAEKSRLISELQKAHKNTVQQDNQLSGMIARLNKQIANYQDSVLTQQNLISELRQKMEEIRRELAEKETLIAAQNRHLEEQEQILKAQDKQLNQCYYLIGKLSELQDMGVVSGGVFKRSKLSKKGFDVKHFTMADMRELESIPLNSKSADILSSVPEGSYELRKGSDKRLTLHILDPESFWSQSRYLVVRIK